MSQKLKFYGVLSVSIGCESYQKILSSKKKVLRMNLMKNELSENMLSVKFCTVQVILQRTSLLRVCEAELFHSNGLVLSQQNVTIS